MKTFTAFAIALAISLSACNKDFEKIKVQTHDSNEMMKLMHTMQTEMDAMVSTNDPDSDFAMMMKMHHQGAINMADKELSDGDDNEIKAIAQQMKNDQQAETTELTAFLNGHPGDTMSMQFHEGAMSSMERMKKAADLQILMGDSDYDFASLMIPHHQSAMEMAQLELDYGKHEEMKQMAREMINAQRMEIERLQTWLIAKKEY